MSYHRIGSKKLICAAISPRWHYFWAYMRHEEFSYIPNYLGKPEQKCKFYIPNQSVTRIKITYNFKGGVHKKKYEGKKLKVAVKLGSEPEENSITHTVGGEERKKLEISNISEYFTEHVIDHAPYPHNQKLVILDVSSSDLEEVSWLYVNLLEGIDYMGKIEYRVEIDTKDTAFYDWCGLEEEEDEDETNLTVNITPEDGQWYVSTGKEEEDSELTVNLNP